MIIPNYWEIPYVIYLKSYLLFLTNASTQTGNSSTLHCQLIMRSVRLAIEQRGLAMYRGMEIQIAMESLSQQLRDTGSNARLGLAGHQWRIIHFVGVEP